MRSPTTFTSVAGFDSATAPAASIGAHSHIAADVAVPRGNLAIADHVSASGAFAAFDVTVGDYSAIEVLGHGLSPSGGGQQQLSGYFVPPMSTAPIAGVVPANTPMVIAVSIEPRGGRAALAADAQRLSDPASPTFRQFLSPSTALAVYGGPASVYDPLVTWAGNAGFTLRQFNHRLVLGLEGTAELVEAAFHVNLYFGLRADGTQFYEPDREPSIDTSAPVLSIQGLDDYVPGISLGVSSGPDGSVVSADVRAAYAGCTSRKGNGQAVGVVALRSTFVMSDIDQFKAKTNVSSTTLITHRPVDSMSRRAGDPETTLDIEMALAIAPGLTEIVAYEGDNVDLIYAGILHDAKDPGPGVPPAILQITDSYFPSVDDGTQDSINMLATMGRSVSHASGDNGGDATQPPHSRNGIDLDRVTVIGGTAFKAVVGGPNIEAAWSEQPGLVNNGSGSGGGILLGDPLPGYQIGLDLVGVAHGVQPSGASTTHRNVPDVAMVAQDVYEFYGGNPLTRVSGTSASSPLWAGFMALVNEQGIADGVGPVGFANPLLYQIAKSSTLYGQAFNDITVGGPGYVQDTGTAYPAEIGWDFATGWGSPRCELINILSPTQPVSTEITHIAATATPVGPYVCMNGTGFFRGRDVHFLYDGIPGRTARLDSGFFVPVAADGTFSATDPTMATFGGILVANCTDEQLTMDQVTVTATDGVNSATSTLPAYLWCGNSHLSGANGGCH